MKLNSTKAAININAEKSNNIEYYVDWLYVASRGLLRGAFIFHLVQRKDAFSSLVSKMQITELVRLTHKKKIEYLTGTLCTLTILMSFFIAIKGLDKVHFYILKTSGWSFEDVFLQHEYDIVSAFTRIRLWKENATDHIMISPLPNTNSWTPMAVILGGTGIVMSFCALLLDFAISDIFLGTTVMLYSITREMDLREGRNVKNLNLAETQTTFKNIVDRFEVLTDLSEAMNELIGGLIQFLISVDVLLIVNMLNHGLDGNWSFVLVYALKLIKDLIGVHLAKTISNEVSIKSIKLNYLFDHKIIRRHTSTSNL